MAISEQDKEVFKGVNVKGRIDEYEKMNHGPLVEEQKDRAKRTLKELKEHKKTLETRREKYKAIRNGSKGLKKQLEDLKNHCKEFIDSIDCYMDELKKRGIKENIDSLKRSKEEAQRRITEIIEMENERPMKKYGANLSKILTLKDCKVAIVDMNDVIDKLNDKGDKDAVEKAKESIDKYSLKLQYSKKCLPEDTKEYEDLYKKIDYYTRKFGNSLEELGRDIENIKDSSDNGWVSSIKALINSIYKNHIVRTVFNGVLGGLGGIFLNHVVVPSVIYAYNSYFN